MNDAEMKRLMAATAAVQLAEAVDAMRRIGDLVEESTGHRVVSRPRNFMDMTVAEFLLFDEAIHAAGAIVRRWELDKPRRPMGAVLKTNQESTEIARLIQIAAETLREA